MLGALALAAALAAPAPAEDGLRGALDLLYDGSTDASLTRLEALAAARPNDPLPAYFAALAFAWKLEQRPASTSLDAELLERADRAISRADARLAKDAADARALFARGAAHGVKSRLHLFRRHAREAAHEAVRMRADLLAARRLDPTDDDALFGLGLYDYYADVLPRLFKLLRFLLGIPAGDRVRGLAAIELARKASRYHQAEAAAQLYEIQAWYEHDQDAALAQIRGLRERHPDSPLWGLKLAEELRDRLGLYAESVAVAHELLEASHAGRRNYAPVVGRMAYLAEGEALLLDLRPGDARPALAAATQADPGAPWIAERARALLARAVDLEADPLTACLAEGRRKREAGRLAESVLAYRRALALRPDCPEARLRVAEADLDAGRVDGALREFRALAELGSPSPPWLSPWANVLLARALRRTGHQAAARQQYNKVFERPGGIEALRAEAAAALAEPQLEH
jgi:hypothetical protein